MSFCRRTVEDRLPLERVPLACTFGSPLDLHVRQSLGLQGPVDLDPGGGGGGAAAGGQVARVAGRCLGAQGRAVAGVAADGRRMAAGARVAGATGSSTSIGSGHPASTSANGSRA